MRPLPIRTRSWCPASEPPPSFRFLAASLAWRAPNFYRPPVKAKGWDTFCPLGPVVVEGEIDDPHRLGLRASVNGELRQQGTTADLAYSVWDLIAFLAEFMTLEPDDVILTGTPPGISHVRVGDRMRIEIDGLGALENVVTAAPRDQAAPTKPAASEPR